MRPYHAYTPGQAFLLPMSLAEAISPDDPVHLVRQVVSKEGELEEEIRRWLEKGERQDAAEDEAYGPADDGYSLPEELREAEVSERAQTNLTDPESRIMHTPDGF